MAGNKSFGDSLLDALSPGNVILKLFQFIIFGLLTAFPYLINNLNQVHGKVVAAGASGVGAAWLYVKALLGATWKGMFIGLSTLWDAMMNYSTVIGERQIGTMFFVAIVLLFATLTVYQPIRLMFDILDRQKGEGHSAWLVGLVSLVVILIVAAPISSFVLEGQTITSGIADDGQETVQTNTTPESGDGSDTTVPPPTEVSDDDRIVNSLDLIS